MNELTDVEMLREYSRMRNRSTGSSGDSRYETGCQYERVERYIALACEAAERKKYEAEDHNIFHGARPVIVSAGGFRGIVGQQVFAQEERRDAEWNVDQEQPVP